MRVCNASIAILVLMLTACQRPAAPDPETPPEPQAEASQGQ